MTYILLDTETTGLEPDQGDRICEIGLLKVRDDGTQYAWSQRLNPEREVGPGASAVNGLTWAMLRNEPRFRDIADRLVVQLGGSVVVIHNAAFDVGFLDAEFRRVYPGWPGLARHASRIICTRILATQVLPGIRHSLNNLAAHYGLATADRGEWKDGIWHGNHHSALDDCYLLAPIYQSLRQEPQA